MRTASATHLLLLLPGAVLPAQNTGVTLTNGVDGFMEVPYDPAIVPQSGMTFEAWITYDDSTIPTGWAWPTVARQNQTSGNEAWFLRVQAANNNSTVLGFKVKTSVGDVDVNWGFSPGQLNVWTHVAGTYDGTMARLFINGNEVANAAGNGMPPWDRGSTLRIGKGEDGGGTIEVWNGQIDEVRLWPFARTAGQIQSTMNMELNSVPGLVATWNLNNDYKDSSGTLHGTPTGTIPFTGNGLNLGPMPGLVGVGYGTSTQGCLGPIGIAAAALPTVGNGDFAVVCTRVPANALAVGFLGFAAQNPPLRLVGVDVLIDPTNASWSLLSADALGAVYHPLPIPGSVPPGLQFTVQIGARDPCGPQGWTASNALGTGTL